MRVNNNTRDLRVLWVDDLRNPMETKWKSYNPSMIGSDVIWVKSYYEFKEYIEVNGLPDVIGFDHDLGDVENEREMTGYDCALFVVDYVLDNELDVLPNWFIQSSNTVGAEKINGLMNNFLLY